MELNSYLKTLTPEQRGALAKAAGTSAAYLIQLAGRHRMPSPSLAKKIEDATEGAVTRRDLRPDIFDAA